MSAISEHTSLPGNFCSGILLTKLPRILSEVGTSCFSFSKVGLALSGHNCSLKHLSSWSSVSFIELSKTVTSAAWIFGHISANASLYAVIKVSYVVEHSSPREDIWSSKMDNAVRNFAKNIIVCVGLFAAVVTEDILGFCVVAIVHATVTEYALK